MAMARCWPNAVGCLVAGLLALFSPLVFCVSAGLLCDFESSCEWQASDAELSVTTGRHIAVLYDLNEDASGPKEDYKGDPDGHFLHVMVKPSTRGKMFNVTSPWFNGSKADCQVKFWANTYGVDEGAIHIVIAGERVSWDIPDSFKFVNHVWNNFSARLGMIMQRFQMVIELTLPNKPMGHVAIDNIRLDNCGAQPPHKPQCQGRDFMCSNRLCVNRSYVCDLTPDCLEGEDETGQCNKVPPYARCDFENDNMEMCDWTSENHGYVDWRRKLAKRDRNGPKLSPSHDHTFKNESGHYLLFYINYKLSKMGDPGFVTTPTFPPHPEALGDTQSIYYNSCEVRFYYIASGFSGQFELWLLQDPVRRGLPPKVDNLWKKAKKKNNDWERIVIVLPYIRTSYRLQFRSARSFKIEGDLGLDDFTLSPECFGLGINVSTPVTEPPTVFPFNITKYRFTTCGGKGRYGPNQKMCEEAYNASGLQVNVTADGDLAGIQMWTVQETGFYSVIAKGAGGGKGARNLMNSHGATASAVFHWSKGDVIYFLVGQEGSSSCSWDKCGDSKRNRSNERLERITTNRTAALQGGSGGGGGGATYVFTKVNGSWKPLLVAAGGGGLPFQHTLDLPNLDGQTANANGGLNSTNGAGAFNGAGGGGGWNDSSYHETSGRSLIYSGAGGQACSSLRQWGGQGGFGGGGGACLSGGGGGGYIGGDAPDPDNQTSNGEGGMSFAHGHLARTLAGVRNSGPGVVEVIKAAPGCDCSYLCVFLDSEFDNFACICPDGFVLSENNATCITKPSGSTQWALRLHHLLIIIFCVGIVLASIGAVSVFLYHRYRRQMMKSLRQELFGNPELQLNRLRQQSGGGGGGMVTDPNPNYEFGGSTCTLQDLKAVSRDNLTLIKALGQGAFGEVYQGILSNYPGEGRELAVAVKTLPELSNSQSETDFIMEALIMSKFNHPNIVHFVGVCFDKLPKFIVLELLAGGDLKSFLRESRPKPNRPSTLNMCDLLMLAMDIAKGCQYLEENHFIHRDIAARNCLLTTKGPGRVVKIADFGMARDIYRADYYRKGGKAMLPVKWMPPEAFLDGIFTSKTDVWSFGVLLWEVMSLGYMPYPGRGNHEVMQLVTSGGRLEPPSNCPSPVYHIMAQCWQNVPDERPNFTTILERLGYCLQDPDVIHAALPVFHRPPSTERDTTVMRPPDSDAMCLQVHRPEVEPVSPASTDYLIPIPSSNYSLSTEKTELPSGSSVESIDKLLELEDKAPPPPPAPAPSPIAAPTWERNFTCGGYTSVPTQEDESPSSSQQQQECRSPPASIARQRPKKSTANAPANHLIPLDKPASSGLSLDASALARQHLATPYPYANVDVAKNKNSDDASSYVIGNHYDKEITC